MVKPMATMLPAILAFGPGAARTEDGSG
eukprot:SAG11_NODE_23916_length_381_cov_0.843972_1_plen_27_part_01